MPGASTYYTTRYGVYFYDGSQTNTVLLTAPAAVPASLTLTLPSTAGLANQVLSTNGSGTLSWISPNHLTLANLNSGTYADGGHTSLVQLAQSAVNPTIFSDVANYKLGTVWVNTASHDVFLCASNASGAASWIKVIGDGMAHLGIGQAADSNALAVTGATRLLGDLSVGSGGVDRVTITGATGDIASTSTTVSTSTTTGALRIAGGAGIAGDLYAAAMYSTGSVVSSAAAPTAGFRLGNAGTSWLAFTNYANTVVYGELFHSGTAAAFFTDALTHDIGLRGAAGSTLRLGVDAGASTLRVSNGYVGINANPGTYALSVNGTAAASTLTATSSWTWAPSTNFTLTAASNSDEWSFDVTPGTYSGIKWNVWNVTTASPAIDVLLSNTVGGRVGINQAAGTETLEVNGNIKCVDLKPTGNCVLAPNSSMSCTATGINQNWSYSMTPGTHTGIGWHIYNNTTAQYALSVSLPTATNGGRVGINQAYGAEALEVNGSALATSFKILNSGFVSTIGFTSTSAGRVITLPDSNLTLTEYSGPNQSVSTTATPNFTRLGVGVAADATKALYVAQGAMIGGTNHAATASVQGLHLDWNREGTGVSYVLNQKGGGTGGIILGALGATNDAVTEWGGFNSSGQLYVKGGANTVTFTPAALTGDRIITLPNASVDLQYIPNQSVSTTATPQFARLGVGQAAGAEVLEVAGNIKTANGNVQCTVTGGVANQKYVFDGFVSGMVTSEQALLCLGESRDANKTAWMAYTRAATLADSTLSMGIWGGSVALTMNAAAKVGINQAPGTEVLEVTGNILTTGTVYTNQINQTNDLRILNGTTVRAVFQTAGVPIFNLATGAVDVANIPTNYGFNQGLALGWNAVGGSGAVDMYCLAGGGGGGFRMTRYNYTGDGAANIAEFYPTGTRTYTTLAVNTAYTGATDLVVGTGGAYSAGAVTANAAVQGTSLKIANSSYTSTFTPATLTTNRTISVPNADVNLANVPDQSVSTISTPQFTRLGVGVAADASKALYVDQGAMVGGTNHAATASVQGLHLDWNREGTGVSYFLNQKGGGSGGIMLGALGATNDAITEWGGFNSSGQLYVKGGTNTVTFAPAALTDNRTITLPNASVDLQYTPNQNVSTTATPQFTKLGLGQAAGTEVLEVAGNIKTANGNIQCTVTGGAATQKYVLDGFVSGMVTNEQAMLCLGETRDTNKTAWLSYTRAATLADSTLSMGIWGGTTALTMNSSARVGIAWAPSATHTLSVNGGAYISGFVETPSYFKVSAGNGSVAISDVVATDYASVVHNVIVGTGAGAALTGTPSEGSGNVFVGRSSGAACTTGSFNTLLGYGTDTPTLSVAAIAAVAIGMNAKATSDSVTVGGEAGTALTSGTGNTYVGRRAGNTSTTGANNICLGCDSDVAAASATNAIAIGYGAVAASNNIVIGNASSTGCRLYCTNVGINQAPGTEALEVTGAIKATTALKAGTTIEMTTAQQAVYITGATPAGFGAVIHNAVVGYGAGASLNTGGSANALFGYNSGTGIIGGGYNTCCGYNAGATLVTGANNVLVGAGADTTMSDVANSIAVGDGAKTVTQCVVIGTTAGAALTTGIQNTYIGHHAGYTGTTGVGNICLGFEANVAAADTANAIAIGYGVTAASNTVVIGNSGNTLNTLVGTIANSIAGTGSGSKLLYTGYVTSIAAGESAVLHLGEAADTHKTGWLAYTRDATLANSTLKMGVYGGSGAVYVNSADNVGIAVAPNATHRLNVSGAAYASGLVETASYYKVSGGNSSVAISDAVATNFESVIHNVIVGTGAGAVLTGTPGQGSGNSFVGRNAGAACTTGSYNTLLGYGSDVSASNLDATSAVGVGKGTKVTSYSVIVGLNAGSSLTIGTDNVCVGAGAGDAITTGSFNTIIGDGSDVSASAVDATQGIAIGRNAICTTNTISMGYNAGSSLTTGTGNVLLGLSAGGVLATGADNCVIGKDATAVADCSNAVGIGSGSNTSPYSVCIGQAAGTALTSSGQKNVFIGATAGNTCTTGDENICIGYNADTYAADESYITVVGANSYAKGGSTVVGANSYTTVQSIIVGSDIHEETTSFKISLGFGGTYITSVVAGQTDWAGTSDERLKTGIEPCAHGLNIVRKIKPIKYKFCSDVERDGGDAARLHYGFGYQQVREQCEAEQLEDPRDLYYEQDGYGRLAPTALIPFMVKAIQQLADKLDALEQRLASAGL